MNSRIVRATPKGQITLPKEWRDLFKSDNFLIQMDSIQMVIKPVDLDAMAMEEVVFDADRDNEGKGVSVDEMIRLLKKVRKDG